MTLHFEVESEIKKKMIRAMENELQVKAKYDGVPKCSFSVGRYTVGTKGEVEFKEGLELEEEKRVVKACVAATGKTPTEWESNTDEVEEGPQLSNTGVTVEVPKGLVDTIKLEAILKGKGNLIKKALGVNNLSLIEKEDSVSFPWFDGSVSSDDLKAYEEFILKLCEMSVNQKRIQFKEKEVENEKYAFRCFLLRLGMIGEHYRIDRKILLRNLEGSSAFKNGKKGEREDVIS